MASNMRKKKSLVLVGFVAIKSNVHEILSGFCNNHDRSLDSFTVSKVPLRESPAPWFEKVVALQRRNLEQIE